MVNKYIQVNFRLPIDLKTNIEESANMNGNSITAEIVERLSNSFEYDKLVDENLELHAALVDSESEKLDLLLQHQDKLFEIQLKILDTIKSK